MKKVLILRSLPIALATAALALTSACNPAPPATVEDVRNALDARQYRIARAHLADLLSRGENTDEVYRLQMQVMLELGNGHAAMAAIEKLPESALSGSERRVATAHSLILQGKAEKAAQFYQDLEADAYSEQDFRMVLWALKEMDEVEDFTLGMDAALDRFPESADLNALAAQSLLDLGIPEEAGSYARQALQTDPSNLEALLASGRVAIHDGDLERALSYYEKAHELYPIHAIPVANIAGLQMDLERLDEAGETLRKGLLAHPDFPLLHWRKARHALLTDDPDTARASLEKARRSFADNPDFALLSGMVEDRLGNSQMAVHEYRRYLKDVGADADVEARISQLAQ